jgi:hypothetical protein
MTEPTDAAPVQPETPAQQNASPDWQARYNGQQAALQKAAEELKALKGQLVEALSQNEQLRLQLSQEQAKTTSVAGDKDRLIEAANQKAEALAADLSRLKALRAKVDAAKALGRYDLLQLEALIPDAEDAEQTKAALLDIASFADAQVKAHEERLLAGFTQTPGQGTLSAAPNSDEAWTKHIYALPEGSQERREAMDAYGDWLMARHK